MSAEFRPPVTLANCDQEPIHLPGLIQPHGVLLAFDDAGCVLHASANCAQLLGFAPRLGAPLAPGDLADGGQIDALVAAARAGADAVPAVCHAVVPLGGQPFDVVAHRRGALTLVEFERQPPDAGPGHEFGPRILAISRRIGQQPDKTALLAEAVRGLRALTGFDRVMAYRFRADDSGDVVAEERVPELPPYLGWRFPASDIPAQARRLYTVNPMRLIADVGSAPVALLSAPTADGAPLDLTHAMLRSVSPIHIEYLQNIGVGASMSLSIVVEGRLWGMLACHHRTPLHVPYAVRAVCSVLADLLSARVHALAVASRAAQVKAHTQLREAVLDSAQHAPSVAAVLQAAAPGLARVFQADAVLVASRFGVRAHGQVPPALRADLVAWAARTASGAGAVLASTCLSADTGLSAEQLQGWCGALCTVYDEAAQVRLILLRREQIEHVPWGHNPVKEVKSGPLGPRLTPPGSFQLWQETVRNTSVPWRDTEVQALRELGVHLRRLMAARVDEVQRHRGALAAMLRREAPALVEAADDNRSDHILQQMMDMVQLQHGRLVLARQPVVLQLLLHKSIERLRAMHPEVSMHVETAGLDGARVLGDAGRLAQLIDNLLDNAVQHGDSRESMVLRLDASAHEATLEISNVGHPMTPAAVERLFVLDIGDERAPVADDGLGVGLYIARAIAQAHGGEISGSYDEPFVTITVRLPLMP